MNQKLKKLRKINFTLLLQMPFPHFRRGVFSHLATIDVFGKAVELNFNRSKKSRTRAGGFLTLLFLGFWIWSIYNVGKDIYQRRNPTMTTADVISVDPKPMTINSDLFTIAFGYADPISASHYKNDSIFTLRVSVAKMHRNIHEDGSITLDWTDTVLETETCTPSHFGELASDFAPLQLDQLTCIKKDQPALDPIVIQGAYGSEIWKYLQVLVFPCDPVTSAVTCGTDDELEFYLGGEGYFAAYFTDMAANMKDYEKPITRFQNSIFTLFGNKGYKELYYTVNPVEINTDSGWWTKEETTEYYAKYETITETTTVAVKDTLLKFRMKVSPTSKIYSRSYIKIQEIFAQANGLATVALMVLLFVITPYANLKFNESIINELFEINPSDSFPDPNILPQTKPPAKTKQLQQQTTSVLLSTLAAEKDNKLQGLAPLGSQRPLFDQLPSPRTPDTDRESVPIEARPSS